MKYIHKYLFNIYVYEYICMYFRMFWTITFMQTFELFMTFIYIEIISEPTFHSY